MDRNTELGRNFFNEAAKGKIPLFRDLRELRHDVDVVDEFALSIGHAVARGAGNAEDRVRNVAESLSSHLHEWGNLRGQWENTVEVRGQIARITVGVMHSRVLENIRLCALHAKEGNAAAKELATVFRRTRKVTGHLLGRSNQKVS